MVEAEVRADGMCKPGNYCGAHGKMLPRIIVADGFGREEAAPDIAAGTLAS